MLTDGAVRMIVLMNFHEKGFSPFTLAYIFLLYEFMGILTNFYGGWYGKKFGLSFILILGACLQISSLVILGLMPTGFSEFNTIIFLIFFQGLCGVAKDLTKVASKTSIKFLSDEDKNESLFKNITWLTGSKNTVKGLGFFVGASLITFFSFSISLFSLACFLAFFFFLSILSLLRSPILVSRDINTKIVRVSSTSREINILSLARLFLFGARDIWFVVGIPVFFIHSFTVIFSLQTDKTLAYLSVGAFMATWVILYGIVQAKVPQIIKNLSTESIFKAARVWSLVLVMPTFILTLTIPVFENIFATYFILFVIMFLFIFGFFFAINSSIHSYLILALTKNNNASVDVGFYYSANALGRFIGTLLSGLSFQFGGLFLCLLSSTIFLLIAYFFTGKLRHKSQKLDFS
jgi:MFS family permease